MFRPLIGLLVVAAITAACGTPSVPPGASEGGQMRAHLLLAPMNARGVPEPARSRAGTVAAELEAYLSKRGYSVEPISFDAFRALQRDPGSHEAGYEALVVPSIVHKEIVSTRTPKWDGVTYRMPNQDLPDGFKVSRMGHATIQVLSFKVQVLGANGDLVHEGIGGLDHLQILVFDMGWNRVYFEPWSKTLTKKHRMRKAISIAMGSYSSG